MLENQSLFFPRSPVQLLYISCGAILNSTFSKSMKFTCWSDHICLLYLELAVVVMMTDESIGTYGNMGEFPYFPIGPFFRTLSALRFWETWDCFPWVTTSELYGHQIGVYSKFIFLGQYHLVTFLPFLILKKKSLFFLLLVGNRSMCAKSNMMKLLSC